MGKKKKMQSQSNFSQKNLWPIAILLGLTLVFFWKAALLKGVFITGDLTTSDLTNLNYPVRHFLSECIKSGYLPLWTPYIYNGFPLLAEGEMGGFYPLTLALFSLLPPYLAYNYSVILNFFLAGFFLFLFARSINLSPWASLIAGFSFAFSGFFVTHLKHLNMIQASIWLPLLLFLVELFFKKERLLYPVLAGLVFGCQILAGHFQMAYYSFLGTAVYFVYKMAAWWYSSWQQFKYRQKQKRHKEAILMQSEWKRILAKQAAALLLIGAIGSGISAVQLLPTYEFTQLATRAGGLSYEDTTAWGYHPKNLITLIFPYWYGDYAKAEFPSDIGGEMTLFWENCSYVGLITLMLGLVAVVALFRKGTLVRFWAVFFICSLLLVLGKYTPIFKLLWTYLPGLSYFRFPNRFLLFTSLSTCLLSGFGFDLLLNKAKTPRSKKALILIVTALVVIDIFAFGFTHNPTVSPQVWLSKPDTVQFLEKDTSLFRIYNFGCDESWRMVYAMSKGWKGDLKRYVNHRQVLQPNFNLIHRISSSEGYPAFAPVRLNNLHKFFRTAPDNVKLYKHSQDDPLGFAVPEPQFTKLLGLLNVKYILSLWELKSPELKEVMTTNFKDMPEVRIYKNEAVIPRAYLVPKAKYIAPEEVLNRLIQPGHDPMKEVIIEERVEAKQGSSTTGSRVDVVKYLPLEIEIKADLTDNGWLVLADTYYPGWKAFVDNKEARIYLANYIQRAIPLSKGKHQIRFVYQPHSFKIGLVISLFIFMIVIGYILAAERRFSLTKSSFNVNII